MATSKKVAHENLRQKYLDILIDFLSTKKNENGEDDGEEILRVSSNVIAFPVVDENGEDEFIEITVKVPRGTKDEAYDGYGKVLDDINKLLETIVGKTLNKHGRVKRKVTY